MAGLGNLVTSYFGTTFEFYGFMIGTVAKVSIGLPSAFPSFHLKQISCPQFRLEDVVEEINEAHVGQWTTMITTSSPPIPNTHFTAYMDVYQLKKHVIAFNADKLKNVVGYQLKRPEFNHETIGEVIEKLKEEGSWPKFESS